MKFSIVKNDIYTAEIGKDYVLCITKCDSNTAQLFITRKSIDNCYGNAIKVPDGFIVYKYNDDNDLILYHPISSSQIYILDYTEDYVIKYNDEIILRMEREKGWNLYN